MLESSPPGSVREEAALLDAVATEKLKSNSRPHVCVLLQPLTPDLLQFVNETSRDCDFRERQNEDDAAAGDGFNRCRFLPNSQERLQKDASHHGSALFLIQRTRQIPEGFFQKVPRLHVPAAQGDPDPNGLGELLRGAVLLQPEARHERAGGGSGRRGCRGPTAPPRLPQVGGAPTSRTPEGLGFYGNTSGLFREQSWTSWGPQEEVAQEVARHCIIQARLLAYRTGTALEFRPRECNRFRRRKPSITQNRRLAEIAMIQLDFNHIMF